MAVRADGDIVSPHDRTHIDFRFAMPTYANYSGSSGVIAYEIGDDYIRVTFHGGKTYRYSYKIAGSTHVDRMKRLAKDGCGLATYISQHVHDSYD